MNKNLIVILTLSLILCMLSGCKSRALPVPDYPLSADAITEALPEWGVSCTIEKDEITHKGRSIYTLLSVENGWFAAGVLSGQKDGERILQVIFPSFYDPYNTITQEECENAIVFATLLFGGVENSHQIYDAFIREYGSINTKRIQNEKPIYSSETGYEERIQWDYNFGDVYCRITFERPKLSEPEEYLKEIVLTGNWDVFFQEP